MIATLLPGLRDLRTPLTTGYVWLLVGYLVIYPLFNFGNHQGGPAADIGHLAEAGGAAAVGAAVSLVAYLVGTLSVGLVRPVLDRTTKPRLIPLVRTQVTGQSRAMLPADKAVRSLTMAVHGELRTRIEKDSVSREEFLKRCEVVEAVLNDLRGAGKATKQDTLGFTSSTEWEQAIRDGQWRTWAAGFRALVPVEGYRDDCVRELESVPPRLLGKDPELWDAWDRLRAEAEFRVSIAIPLGALVAVLCVRWSALWIIGLAAVFFLMYLGRLKSLEAVQLLAETMAAGRVESTALESLGSSSLKWIKSIRWSRDFEVAITDSVDDGVHAKGRLCL